MKTLEKPAFFKNIIDTMTVGGLFVDKGRMIRYCNSGIGKIFGYAPDEIMGKRTGLLYGDRRIDPRNKTEIHDFLEKSGFHIGRAVGKTKSGKKIGLQLFTFLVQPNSGAIIIIKEVKEKPGNILFDKDRLLQDLLGNIPDMIYFKDMNNRFILVNKAHAAALGKTPEEVVGKTDMDFFPRRIAKSYFADDSRVIKSGKAIIGKIEKARRPGGGMTYVSTTKIPHYNEKGKIIGMIGITRNITDKMIAEEELLSYKDRLEELITERTKELEQSKESLLKMYNIKSDFVSMVSHELRTPLTIIKTGLSAVRGPALNFFNKQQKHNWNIILKNINRLSRLIDGVLDLSKFESKKMKLKLVTGNINGVINNVIASFEGLARERGLKLRVKLDPALPLVKFDTERIAQVLYNLIDNAIKYTNKGRILIESKSYKKEVTVSVKDSGCGIRKEDLSKIFCKFQRLDSDDEIDVGGTGLGLAICKHIIEQLGGRISVESRHGKGSCFSFSLPVA